MTVIGLQMSSLTYSKLLIRHYRILPTSILTSNRFNLHRRGQVAPVLVAKPSKFKTHIRAGIARKLADRENECNSQTDQWALPLMAIVPM